MLDPILLLEKQERENEMSNWGKKERKKKEKGKRKHNRKKRQNIHEMECKSNVSTDD